MPVKVKCASCDKVLTVPDAARGKAVKCPQCESRIPVPAEEESSKPKSASAKSKPKKTTEKVDTEEALAKLDMRRAEDTEARICPKCGFDMHYQDEEDNECPQCGYDSSAGGLGARAKKKAMRGPDPADFYPGLVKEAWKFVAKNKLLALRTVMYTVISLAIALCCGFMYFWISMWPPRVFLALCFTVSFLVVPGWMWFLDTEVIKLTLERKDKFKRLNFDFFLASAMGAAFVFWSVAVMLPLLAIPAGLGYAMVKYSGMPEYILPVSIAIGLIPAFWMLPVVMSHMAMPVQYRGWMVWKLIPIWARNIKPLSFWLLWFLITNIPQVAGIATIAAVYGPEIQANINILEDNARIARIKFSREQNPNTRKKGEQAPVLEALPDLRPYSLKPAIVPCVILAVMSLINGFTSLFNMRTNGQFTYYNKASLELIDRAKEYKYKAREKVDEDEDEKPKSTAQYAVDGLVFMLVFGLLGVVGGMLFGSFTDAGMTKGIIMGMMVGFTLSVLVAYVNGIKDGFQDSPKWGMLNMIPIIPAFIFVSQNWEYRRPLFFQNLYAIIAEIGILIAAMAFQVPPFASDTGPAGPQATPTQTMPQMGMPGQMMPGQMGMPGAPGAAPPGAAPPTAPPN